MMQAFCRAHCDALQALAEKNAAIAESERCQRKLGLANRLIAALASEGDRWALTVQQLRKDYQVSHLTSTVLRRQPVHAACATLWLNFEESMYTPACTFAKSAWHISVNSMLCLIQSLDALHCCLLMHWPQSFFQCIKRQ